jgi:hypothetical protein
VKRAELDRVHSFADARPISEIGALIAQLLSERERLIAGLQGSKREHAEHCAKVEPWFQGHSGVGVRHDACECGADSYNAGVEELLKAIES